MTTTEKLAYCAGLVDGEGCVGMYLNSHNGNYQLRISVEMGDREGLKILDELFPGKWYYRPPLKPRREKWTWMLFNANAYKALIKLEPYLAIKHKHVEEIKKADWISFKGKPLTKDEKTTREKVAKKVKSFNRRGYYGEANKSQRRSWSK